jgi:hypothetical protein
MPFLRPIRIHRNLIDLAPAPSPDERIPCLFMKARQDVTDWQRVRSAIHTRAGGCASTDRYQAAKSAVSMGLKWPGLIPQMKLLNEPIQTGQHYSSPIDARRMFTLIQ